MTSKIPDPDAPGRGPRFLGKRYRWERVDDFPIVGTFAGFELGERKGADTLFVDVGDGQRIEIRYEHLVSAIQVKRCAECKRMTLLRQTPTRWQCSHCGLWWINSRRTASTPNSRTG